MAALTDAEIERARRDRARVEDNYNIPNNGRVDRRVDRRVDGSTIVQDIDTELKPINKLEMKVVREVTQTQELRSVVVGGQTKYYWVPVLRETTTTTYE